MTPQKDKDIPDLNGLVLLITDADPHSMADLAHAIEGFRGQVRSSADTSETIDILSHERINVIIAGLDMVNEKFIETVKAYKAHYPDTLLYLTTEHEYDSIEPSSEILQLVVDDYLHKPVDPLRFGWMIATNFCRPCTETTSLTVVEPSVAKVQPYFLFRSEAMRQALARLPEIAASNQTVLVSGETGTGKELVARAIHVLSPRSSGPFIPVNCGAIPESLIEGELFGHEKGAFTGAIKTRRGKFETANGGTIFLDEIGDMPINLQVRLLRVLEEKKIYRVGAERPVPIDVRVIGATRIDLEKAVDDGLFREDLYYRLNILRIYLPPLRERIDDIPLLAVHFLDRAWSEMGRAHPYPTLSSETIYFLERIPWKGNVRELRNIMTRVATMIPPDAMRIFPQHIIPHLESLGRPSIRTAQEQHRDGIVIPSGSTLDQAEALLIEDALAHTHGNRTKAAQLLGVSLRTLRRRLNEKHK